jgi:hypothetical protein
MTRQPCSRLAAVGQRLTVLALISVLTGLIGGCTVNHPVNNPDKLPDKLPDKIEDMTEEQQIKLIDSMRAKGSYEEARENLNASARMIAYRIMSAVPGQSWTFDNDPNIQESDRDGSPCKLLPGDVARRPQANTIEFYPTFSAEGFKAAADIVRKEAADYGATDQSSLFNESANRDYNVSGNGYDFQIAQAVKALLFITGDCFLFQKTLDLPPGQLPPLPPILPTTTPPGR